ncbi:Uncharacterised protein [uncultured Comamonas sp.]|nr:Uncharacterised protein [uncultured Comamonas sp.]
MKETGLMFKAPLVRAILEGRKTQTRRIAKPVRHPDLGNVYSPGALVLEHEPQHVINRACPYGQPGDRIYVRETYAEHPHYGQIAFRADGEEFEDADGWLWEPKWRPSSQMPKELARIWLEVTGVRVERLQGISEADAKAEGIDAGKYHGLDRAYARAFSEVWESTGGDWAANPWVWVVDFKVLSTKAVLDAAVAALNQKDEK